MSLQKISAVAAAAFVTLFGFAAVASAQEVIGAPRPWELGLQPTGSPVKEQLTDFHNLLLVIISGITLLVLVLLVYVVLRFNAKRNPTPTKTSHNTLLEVAWTVLPVVILIVIAVPSFKLLYFMDRSQDAEMTIKATGHQWYWEYEYPDDGINFSAYMIPDEELPPGGLRLLETDTRVVLPVETDIRILVTAGDVLHSWAIPAFGIKTDAVPGRLNETWVRIEREGLYYGQCSEICGTGHGFMPIAIQAVSREEYASWLEQAKVAYGTGDGTSAAKQVAAAPAAD